MSWQETLAARLPLYGHRNWIVVTDSAYPAQISPGIETIASGGDQAEVLEQVLHVLSGAKHVRPVVYLDRELQFVSDVAAPGASAYCARLKALLHGQNMNVLPHEEIIARLDEAGKTFRVLLIKTTMTIPYTSVFLQLDCGYWSDEAERELRGTMQSGVPFNRF